MKKNLDLPHVLTAKDIQLYLNISSGKAYELFKAEGFPTIIIGKSKRVYKEDFLNWVEKQKLGGEKHDQHSTENMVDHEGSGASDGLQ